MNNTNNGKAENVPKNPEIRIRNKKFYRVLPFQGTFSAFPFSSNLLEKYKYKNYLYFILTNKNDA